MSENLFKQLKNKINIPIVIVLLIMFFSMLVFFYLKADEVTKDPCSICAEYMGEKVVCTTGTTYILQKIYYPNGSISDNKDELEREARKNKVKDMGINQSQLNDLFNLIQ